jgi:putative DNA primase/helicase
MHVYYRSSAAGPSRKLACAVGADPATGGRRVRVRIEVKGERSYCLAPPSPPACHPSGRPYAVAGPLGLADVPTVSPAERQVLFDVSAGMDERSALPPPRPPVVPIKGRRLPRPGDDFNASADWADVLGPHGWRWVSRTGDGVDHWRRPGKGAGTSATTNYAGSDLLYVFTSSAAPFEPGRAYSKFAAYALLGHNGDFAAAARALRKRGYGSDPELANLLNQQARYRGYRDIFALDYPLSAAGLTREGEH